ncbi:MAG: hypothetical protein C0615_08420 [Desulfuromonas sp.]|nr:MAG: hypothetical protein C0615_08420 [Desulfuromonas sp.]
MVDFKLLNRWMNASRTFIVFCVFFVFSVSISQADTLVGGRISSDTIWDLAGSPYIVTSTLQVYGEDYSSATLTIEAGVEVRFDPTVSIEIGSRLDADIQEGVGALIVIGTSGSPVLFTNNSNASIWGQMIFHDSTDDRTTRLEYASIDCSSGLYFYAASPSLKNCIIENVRNISAAFWLMSSNAIFEEVEITTYSKYGIMLPGSSPTITGGSLTNQHPEGEGIFGGVAPKITDFTISLASS